MGDYSFGWKAAHAEAVTAVGEAIKEAGGPEGYEQHLRGELDQIVEEAEGEEGLAGEAREGFRDGARIHRKRLREILDGEGDWEEKQPLVYEALDELSSPPDSGSKLRKDLGLD